MSILKNKIFISFLILALIALATGEFYFLYSQNRELQTVNSKLSSLENDVLALQKNSQDSQKQFDSLVEKSKSFKQQADSLMDSLAKLQNKPPEIIRQEIIQQKSQDELLTEAVGSITPAVVSIVISKDVPKLEIVYVNPFGDDPFFKDFGVRIPTYRQAGTEEKKVGAGTGFLVSPNGYIVTNRHVVEDTQANYTVLLSNGEQKPAQVLYKDADIDVAIVKIEGSSYKYVNFGDSSSLKLGQTVFAVGNALGEYNNSVSTGIVSGLNRDIQASGGTGTELLKGVVQTDAAINPGNSGGPLVTLEGKVIGVNVATVIGSNSISFSIPINTVKNIIQSVIK